jgi:predicted MFS family arabinose efflux permease
MPSGSAIGTIGGWRHDYAPPMPTIPSVWRERDFIRLWAATTVSMFGSFVTRTALPFAAILVLGAGAGEVAILRSAELVAGLALGLIAGAWVDRLRRRPILIWADLGRAVLLGTIPVASAFGGLTLVHLVVVAFGAAVLTTFFDTADRAFLPTIIGRGRLVEANATLTGSSSAAEFVGFGVGGWLVQILTAPIAIAIDAVSFLVSAVLLGGIRDAEPPPRPPEQRPSVVNEIREGLRLTLRDPILRPLALADAAVAGFWGVFGAVYLVFATEIGFEPGVIGMIAAIGGLSSLAGATFAGRAVRRLGVARFFIGTMVLVTIGNAFIALTPDATILGLACLLAQQLLSDSSLTAFDVVAVSIRQATVDDRELGRVVASFHTLAMATMLLGTVIGGLVAELVGVRAALVVAASGGPVAIAILWFSRIRRMHDLPAALRRPDAAVLAGDDVPLSE